MSNAIEVRETYKKQRLGGVLLALIGMPLTVLWLLVGFPPRYDIADLVFVIGGPGLLAFGLWMALRKSEPKLRLTISGDGLVLYPQTRDATPVTIPWDDLTSVTQTGLNHDNTRLRFAATTGEHVLRMTILDTSAAEVLHLITIQLENRNQHLAQTSSPVLGAPTGIWEVRSGNPFDSN